MSEMIIDEFHYHEVIERLHIINVMIDNFLLDHPLVEQELALRHLIQEGQNHLERAYQLAGNMGFDKFPEAK